MSWFWRRRARLRLAHPKPPQPDPDAALAHFVVGQVVRLRGWAHGRAMLVQRVVGYHYALHTGRDWGVECAWHDDEGRPAQATYHPAMLSVDKEER